MFFYLHEFGSCLLLEHSLICKKCIKFEHYFLEVERKHILGVVGNVIYYCVGNSTDFPAVKKFWKSVKIWRNYHHKSVARFFGTQCSSSVG